MIRSARRIEAMRLGAALSNHALVHSRLRLHAVKNARVVSEDDLLLRAFQRAGAVGRPVVTLLLAGRGRVRAHGEEAWLEAGEAVGMDHKGAVSMRQEGEVYAALAFEWDVDFLGPRPQAFQRARLAGAAKDEATSVWEALVRGESRPEALVERHLHLLSTLGFPVRSAGAGELAEPVPEATQKLARGLDFALSNLEGQPMTADLEKVLGLGARQVNRLVQAFNARYGFNAAGWRDTRNRRRLMMGATLMTAKGATVGYVARVVGYRSPTAFARALADAGMPPPASISSIVEGLARPVRLTA
jgi:AraC-like DNA-binding protein